jgi:hypothetical protein
MEPEMSPSRMTNVHQSTAPWEWPLEAARATRVDAEARPRWLAVTSGRAWLTRSGAGVEGGDVWLEAGERHLLPAGSEWVVEGWPQARVELLEEPKRCALSAGARRWRVWPSVLSAV